MKKKRLAVMLLSVTLSAFMAIPALAELRKAHYRIQNEDKGTGEAMTVIGEPVEYISLSKEQQYEINIFLSNFAEQHFGSFVRQEFRDPAYFDISVLDINELAGFCHSYTKINTDYQCEYKTFPHKEWGSASYEVYSLEQFNKVLDRFFGITFTDDEIKTAYIEDGYSFYKNSNFYFMAADGETYPCFAVANAMYKDSYGNCVVNFDIYQMDFDLYWEYGKVSKKYYALSPGEAKNTAGLSKVAEGRAVVVPFRYNSRNTYQLKSYYVAGQY